MTSVDDPTYTYKPSLMGAPCQFALRQEGLQWERGRYAGLVRYDRASKDFQLFSVDASKHWIAETRRRIPEPLSKRVTISYSPVGIGTHNGQLCHFYKKLPNVVPDFIYLDGPSPKDVKGSVNGLDFSIDERTVMSGDLLLLESTMLPGTFVVVDGRVNNARFLQRNFIRNFIHSYSREDDITTFELDEPPLGRHSHNLAKLVAAHKRT